MKKNDYIEKAKNLILNRVRFHAPVVYDAKIDKAVLSANGIDLNKPIFKFDKVLNKNLLKAFSFAQKEEPFNLLLSLESIEKINPSKLKMLENYVFFSQHSSPLSFLEMINKLNINYSSSSNYNVVFKDKFIKINDEILNSHFDDFCLKQSAVFDDVVCDLCEFLLNGSNYFLKFKNTQNQAKKLKVEFNIPLKKGYYYFKKINKAISIENLLSKQKLYLNYACKNAKFSFSNVDGLENSVFCCINVKIDINVAANQTSFVFFNLGESKFVLDKLSQIQKFMSISKQKCCEIFNLRVKTKNQEFDQFFNHNLPKKIWIDWANGENCPQNEEKYLSLKRLFIKGSNEIDFVPFKKIGLKQLGIFNGEYYKKIMIIDGSSRYLQVGKTFYHNINSITNFTLKSKESINLCFG